MLRRGSWATTLRLRRTAAIVVAAYLVGLSLLLLTSNGMVDRMNRPLGTDFSQVWAAGTAVREGRPEAPYDPPTHAARQRAIFGENTPFYGWHYPPFFLGLAVLLAGLPYLGALAVWQAVTLALYLASVLVILRHAGALWRDRGLVLLVASAFPAVFVNLTHGHNGFLTAALLAFGALSLERRPILAGLLFGLLAYKPQFALVLPVALVAGAAWRTILAALVTVATMALASLAAFGTATWEAFFGSLAFTRTVVLEQGDTGWAKIQSPFAAVRMLGGSVDGAYAVQGAVTIAALIAVALVWRSRADRRLNAGLLMVASLLTTPYSLDYDLMVLGPALAFGVAYACDKGFLPWEKTLLAAVWIAPGITRAVAGVTAVPLGLIAECLLFGLLAARTGLFARASASGQSSAGVHGRSTLA